MPTPWPNPAPLIVRRPAASAADGSAQSAMRMRGMRRRTWGRRTRERDRSSGVTRVHRRGRFLRDHRIQGVGHLSARRASDVFVECLEAEGVRYVFGIPGEETLDLNESLANSSVSFVPVRHEQGGAFMADMYGRLTGRAGVCLGTLGPGATNLVTAVADAFLDRAP